jgi:hypothetical protein
MHLQCFMRVLRDKRGIPVTHIHLLSVWSPVEKCNINVWDSRKQFMTNFSYQHAEWTAPIEFSCKRNFDSRLRIKVTALSSSPYVCIGKPYLCNVFLPIKKNTGVRGTWTTLYRTLCIARVNNKEVSNALYTPCSKCSESNVTSCLAHVTRLNTRFFSSLWRTFIHEQRFQSKSRSRYLALEDSWLFESSALIGQFFNSWRVTFRKHLIRGI